MRSFDIYLSRRDQFVYQVQKCIPRKWKQTVKQAEMQSTHLANSHNQGGLLQATSTTSVVFMTDSLFQSLKNFADQGNLTKAVRVYSVIHKHAAASLSSSEFVLQSLSCLLLCCINLRAFQQGKQLHAYVISLGLQQDPKLVPKLITFYSSFGLLLDAHVITKTSNILHPLPWNLLISSYVRHGLYRNVFSAYSEMIKKGVRPDNFTYPSLLKACAGEENIKLGRVLHRTIIKSRYLDWCLYVQNALVSMYGRCGDIYSARVLFDKMLDRDAVSWNSIISAYASNGMWAEAFELFQGMRLDGVEINMITWNTIIGGRLRIGDYGGALECLSEMRKCVLHLDDVSLCIGLSACSHIGLRALTLGKEIHAIAIRSSLSEADNVKNALVTMYSKSKELNQAYMLFESVEVKDIISWNSIISGYAHWEYSEKASFLLREMFLSGMKPNYITLVSIISLCGRVANLQHGKEIHCYITRRVWFKDDLLLLGNALIDMYARSGKVVLARQLFDLSSQRNVVTYTSLITGYGIQGEGQTALGLFDEMIKFQIKPDHVTMVAVLSACSHSCLIIQGERLFSKMESVYGITPCFEHFSCMVDLYGRAGLLKKAKAIIMKMPYKPTAAVWATLINVCRIHGNTEIGEWASERLLEMQPNNAGYYVMIANTYAAAGSWDKLAKVRTIMRDLGVRKPPGCAWVNVGAGSFPFLVEDMTNPEGIRVHPVLGELTKQIKDVGYFMENMNINDEYAEERRISC
ncbi:pentatricopeptide repeat-containing protein At1g71490 [Impatiens glandulifera]|uniref:pentatricopeptide repeat-containing protein At1g71490 n=1 Tax=Impatiens glandulifera TaxID=253017 RepID=UPI001FB13314|nr:pentatricopeptide repeat-containing protein At1g71490 [Impatiens glandulifera]